FHQWSGNASGSTNPLSVTVNSNTSVTATFVQPPAISSQPTGGVVNVGSSFSFSVGAIGTAPLSYQWLLNGGAVSGATAATLSMSNIQTIQAGDYRGVVTGPYGSATSQVATLVVNCPGTNVVTACTDDALRQAVAIGGLIKLCCNGTITLTNTINITNDVTLDASGQNVAISGNNAVRLFNVGPGVTFTASNLWLIDGRNIGANGANADGGTAQAGQDAAAGAIYNNGGSIRLSSCILSNNAAIGGAGGNGGTTLSGSGGYAYGGAIWSTAGVVRLDHVTAISNRAVGGPPGVPALDGLRAG